MCLIIFAHNCHPNYRLTLGANRDEFRNRPADPAGFWSDAPHLLAGRDRQAGGTWMGVTTAGKVAAITNYRDPRQQMVDPPSRGKLVSDYLLNENLTPEEYQATLNHDGQQIALPLNRFSNVVAVPPDRGRVILMATSP